MKAIKLIIVFLTLSIISCKDSKQKIENKTKLPKVVFDLSQMPKNIEIKPEAYVNDLEKIFTKEQNEQLENFLVKLEKENEKRIMVLTIPSKEKVNKDWHIENGLTNNGIIITISKSSKDVGIGIAKDTQNIFPESLRKEIIEKFMIPEFENGHYYSGVEKGIKQILKEWK